DAAESRALISGPPAGILIPSAYTRPFGSSFAPQPNKACARPGDSWCPRPSMFEEGLSMKTHWGWILCAASCAVLVTGALLPRREPVPASDSSFVTGGVFEEASRVEQLGGQAEALTNRREARRAVAEAVIAGNMSVEQATQRFLELNRMPPECMTALRLANPGASDKECARRQVMELVKSARAELATKAKALPGEPVTQGGERPDRSAN